jgi:hypothetical protein
LAGLNTREHNRALAGAQSLIGAMVSPRAILISITEALPSRKPTTDHSGETKHYPLDAA